MKVFFPQSLSPKLFILGTIKEGNLKRATLRQGLCDKRIDKLGELRKALERAKQEAEEQGVAADLLQEHKCGVCNTQLDSPTIAIAHYSSPAHSKRVGRVGQEEGVGEVRLGSCVSSGYCGSMGLSSS